MLFPNNVNLDVIDNGGTVRRFETFTSTNDVQFKPLADVTGFGFQTQAATDIVRITSTGVGVFTIPTFKFHVQGATAGDVIGKIRNTSATGFGVSFVPGTDANYGIAVKDSTDTNLVFTMLGTGKAGVYGGVATAGNGLASVHGSTSQKTESAADTNVLTFTPPATAGTYRITFSMAVSAQNTATLGWTATWKDSNGQAQAPTNLSLFASGTAAPALTFVVTTNGIYYGTAIVDVDNSATAIVVKLTFAGTSFTAKASANIERIV